MLRHLVCAIAVTGLVAGCSGGDDKPKSDATGGASETAGATPAAPSLTAYDPPKAFETVDAVSQDKDKTSPSFDAKVGIYKDTALWSDLAGLHGRSLATKEGWLALADGGPAQRIAATPTPTLTESPSESASESATATETPSGPGVQTLDVSAPVPVKLAGKDVVAVALFQKSLGGGTTKDHNQVRVEWIDPTSGEVAGKVDVNVTPTIGEDEVNAGLSGGFTTDLLVDPASGAAVIGLAPASLIGAKSGIFSVYADPAGDKGSTFPFVEPAGLSKGVLVGVRGEDKSRRVLVGIDVNSRATKFSGLKGKDYAEPLGQGGKHAYLYADTYDKGGMNSRGAIYAVDMATGAVVTTPVPGVSEGPLVERACSATDDSHVLCRTSNDGVSRSPEIFGFDDNTGKKVWGWSGKPDTTPRVVPEVTAIFHGVVYGYTDNGVVMLDGRTGQDIPVPTPTPSQPSPTASSTPTDGSTASSTPGDGSVPSETMTPTPDLGLSTDGKQYGPAAVSEYGAVLFREDVSSEQSLESQNWIVIEKAIAGSRPERDAARPRSAAEAGRRTFQTLVRWKFWNERDGVGPRWPW